MSRINGIIVPCITFFNKDNKIELELNSLLMKHVLLNGADALFIFGNTGEGITFYDNVSEKTKYIDIAFQHAKNKIPVLLGIFGNRVDEIMDQIEFFSNTYKSLNFVIAPPFQHKLDENGLKNFFSNILGGVKSKNHIYLYNNPNRFAGNKIVPIVLKDLLGFLNLKGIKDTTDDLNNTKAYLEFLNQDFSIYCGEESNYSSFLKMVPNKLRKLAGLVPSINNITNVCKKMYDNALNGKDAALDSLQNELKKHQRSIYDIKVPQGQEPRGLKHAFYYLYADQISIPENEATRVSTEYHRILEEETKIKLKSNLNELIRSKMILKVL